MNINYINETSVNVCFKSGLCEGTMSVKAKSLFGKNLKRLMKLRRITVNELSEKVGVQLSMVSRWRSGTVLPTQYLDSLCKALRVDLYEFFIDPSSLPEHPTTMEDWVEALANSIGYELKPKR